MDTVSRYDTSAVREEEHEGWARSDPHPAASQANATYKPGKCYARFKHEDA